MKNNLIEYVRSSNGRFTKSAKYVKVLFVLLAIASFILNYSLAKQFLVFQCSEGGYFMTKEKCGELEVNRVDSQELARLVRVQENPDLFNN